MTSHGPNQFAVICSLIGQDLKALQTRLEKTAKNQSKLVQTGSGKNTLKTGLDHQNLHMFCENKL